MDKDLTKRADALVAGVKPADVHPDLAALLGSYARVKDSGANERVVQAHARPLVRLAESLDVEPKKPAKKSTRRRKG